MELTREERAGLHGRPGRPPDAASTSSSAWASSSARSGCSRSARRTSTPDSPAGIVTRSVEPVLAVGPLVGEALCGQTIPIER
jgi:hypothetical protein